MGMSSSRVFHFHTFEQKGGWRPGTQGVLPPHRPHSRHTEGIGVGDLVVGVSAARQSRCPTSTPATLLPRSLKMLG